MAKVKLLTDWTDTKKVFHPVGTELEVDDNTAKCLRDVAIAEWVGMTSEEPVSPA